MIVSATPDEAVAVLRAMRMVASAAGTLPLSAADLRGISSASDTVFGHGVGVDVDRLPPISPEELAAAVPEAAPRLTALRMLAVMALDDGVIEDAKLELVGRYAQALDVHADFVTAMAALLRNDIAWAAFDQIRHNVATIPGIAWDPADPYRAFLPYGGDAADPVLRARYETLAAKPEGSTSAQGELLVAAFTAAAKKHNSDMMESHVPPTILIYHMGIEINKGLNAGDRERMAADPSWRDNYQGNVHLGLDAAKLWVAWDRGAATTEDVYSGHWDFWSVVDEPVDGLRTRYGIPPLDPADAAVADDEVRRADFEREGMRPPPRVSAVGVADRPASPEP